MGTINYIILHFGSFITNEAGFPQNKMWMSKLRASLEEPKARTQEAQVALSTVNGGAKRSGRGKA